LLDAGIRDEFREEPVDTDVVVGETATLHCRAPRGEPEPRIRWLKDGGRLRASDRVMIDVQGALTVRDARREDAASYVCVASNVAGEQMSTPAQLHIRGSWSGDIYPLSSPPAQSSRQTVSPVDRYTKTFTLDETRQVLQDGPNQTGQSFIFACNN